MQSTWPAVLLRETVTGLVVLSWLVLLYQVAAFSIQRDIAALGPGMELLQIGFDWAVGADNEIGKFLLSICSAATSGEARTIYLACFGMWMIKVCAMMLPAIFPFLETGKGSQRNWHKSLSFVCGFSSVWIGFAALAAGLQSLFQINQLLDETLVLNSSVVSVGLIAFAVGYRVSAIGKVARKHCNTYAVYLKRADHSSMQFRTGTALGMKCIKCCWPMMLVMLAFGMMNLVAMAFLTALGIWDRSQNW